MNLERDGCVCLRMNDFVEVDCFAGFNRFVMRRVVAPAWADTTTTDQSETASEAPSTPATDIQTPLRTPRANRGGKKHHFIPKTVRTNTYYEI